jgi:hypothetical protein
VGHDEVVFARILIAILDGLDQSLRRPEALIFWPVGKVELNVRAAFESAE